MLEWTILVIAAFLAGILNSIAGGGSFLTFPALVFAGIPPIAANATSAVAVFPGYLGAVAGFRKELLSFERNRLFRFLVVAMLGGLVGSMLLLVTSNTIFTLLVPWLLLFATVLFTCGERLLNFLKSSSGKIHLPELFTLFCVSVYGGYFNGGLGIILLAVLLLLGLQDLNLMNGIKNGISFCISIVSVVTFAVAGLVHWPQAIVMMTAATFGGYFGAIVAKKIPSVVLKYFITIIGLIMSVIFFVRS